ncbi:type I-F CRISPR-associated protein Cas7f/Csy3 [Azohydromonas aeria]|uniref:type I-F CRISPR-associated protein Cas7f/Csy3 n=1 Tax=Azohydromonas aeria TaxID=2590212 RepID=UPI0012FA467A|nr:type I-F CRISPR-associated protein Cas7f/Csy3 [Azohydromonas aeria]
MLTASPSILSFARTLEPSHMLMFSAPAMASTLSEMVPVTIREEPLRGLNATSKTPLEKRDQAILQVIESSELALGHEVLVLRGRLLIKNRYAIPQACSEPGFLPLHAQVLEQVRGADAGIVELSTRYAIQTACGMLGWRNYLTAERHWVTVESGSEQLEFDNMLRDEADPFSLDTASYETHRRQLQTLKEWIADALLRDTGQGLMLHLQARYRLGLGARVYPSQEWPSEDQKRASQRRWPGGEGVTRMLAKLRRPDGGLQAIINDRKAGNTLRQIDTWYPDARRNKPIAVEPYGANSHEARAYRRTTGSMKEIIERLARGGTQALSREERMFYAACCIRGGVFGGSDE